MPSPGSTAIRCGRRSRGCWLTGGDRSTVASGAREIRSIESRAVLRLHVVPAQGAPFDHLLDGDSLVIGRSSTSDLPLPDRFLSRHHARLFRAGDQYLVEDLGSRNGTLLNGTPVATATAVRPGDVIRISGSVLSVHAEDSPADSYLERGHTVFPPVAELVAQEKRRAAM